MSVYHAFLVDGPLGGEHFHVVARKLPDLLYVAQTPEGIAGPIADRWMVVGTDETPPVIPLDGQAVYGLDHPASICSRGRGIVVYGWIDPDA